MAEKLKIDPMPVRAGLSAKYSPTTRRTRVMEKTVLHWIMDVVGDRPWMLQQDPVPCHVCHVAKGALLRRRHEEHVAS